MTGCCCTFNMCERDWIYFRYFVVHIIDTEMHELFVVHIVVGSCCATADDACRCYLLLLPLPIQSFRDVSPALRCSSSSGSARVSVSQNPGAHLKFKLNCYSFFESQSHGTVTFGGCMLRDHFGVFLFFQFSAFTLFTLHSHTHSRQF